MSEHDELVGALRDIAATLERIEAKLGQPEPLTVTVTAPSIPPTAEGMRGFLAALRQVGASPEVIQRCEAGIRDLERAEQR